MNDGEVIAKAIRYLDEHYREQPDLAQLALVAGLSQYNFHRMFTAWAGVTPKEFLQFLTAAHAERLLRKGESVLAAAIDSGLSGPGRLHDLCVTLEAASPGEVKSGGAGLRIEYGRAETPFGACLMAETQRGICRVSFVDGDFGAAAERLRCDWPNAEMVRNDGRAEALAERVFSKPGAPMAPLRAHVKGTAFQMRVWKALLEVGPGYFVSYGELAMRAGAPRGARAVGGAMSSNPLVYLIPCHRVIRETGAIGGYGGGLGRKRAMIAWEAGLLRRAATREPASAQSPTGGQGRRGLRRR